MKYKEAWELKNFNKENQTNSKCFGIPLFDIGEIDEKDGYPLSYHDIDIRDNPNVQELPNECPESSSTT